MDIILHWSPEKWVAIFTGIGTFIVFIGSIVGIHTLVVTRRNLELQAIMNFVQDLDQSSDDRKYVLSRFDRNGDFANLLPDERRKVENVINCLSRIEYLIDHKLLPAKQVMRLCHGVIIRCWYMLQPYANYYQEQIGGPYAQRVHLLNKRAQRYHDSSCSLSKHQIRLYRGNQDSILIYETKKHGGMHGIIQRSKWKIQKLWRILSCDIYNEEFRK